MNMRGKIIGHVVLTIACVLGSTFPGGCQRPLRLFDGFEGGEIGGFWLPGNYGSGRYEPGAVTISQKYARAGRSSVEITVQQGDIEQISDDGTFTERAELDSGKHRLLHRDVWCGFSFLIPSGFPVVDNRLIIAQWKQNGIEDGPLIAQRFRGARHQLTIRTPGASANSRESYPLPDIVFDRWNDMIYHVRFSPDQDGQVEVWMNGTRVVTHTGAVAFRSGKNWFYNKIGLYRDRWKDPMTIFFDNYTLGDSSVAVDPARFDP